MLSEQKTPFSIFLCNRHTSTEVGIYLEINYRYNSHQWVLAARARPCAARTRLFGLIATPNGALRAQPPIAASLFLIRPPKIYIKYIELGPPMSKGFFFPLDHRGYEIGGPLSPAHRSFADPLGNIFGVTIMTRCALIFWFFHFSQFLDLFFL